MRIGGERARRDEPEEGAGPSLEDRVARLERDNGEMWRLIAQLLAQGQMRGAVADLFWEKTRPGRGDDGEAKGDEGDG